MGFKTINENSSYSDDSRVLKYLKSYNIKLSRRIRIQIENLIENI